MKRQLLEKTILQLATLGVLGTRFPAPGTMGTLAGMMVFAYFVSFHEAEILWCCFFSLILFGVGVPICSISEKITGLKDPPSIIWDEFCVIPFIFICLDDTSLNHSSLHLCFWLSLGFLFFRFFDILKPFGIKKLQSLPRGWGVMTDDLVAALFASVILGILQTLPLSFL